MRITEQREVHLQGAGAAGKEQAAQNRTSPAMADGRMNYEAPRVEVIEVAVEAGFAASSDGGTNDYGWGGGL